MANRIKLREWVTWDGDRFVVTYISRRPSVGRGLFCVLEAPRRGLKIVRYRDLAAKTENVGQAKSSARTNRVTRLNTSETGRLAKARLI